MEKIALRTQLLSCAALAAVGIAIIWLFHAAPLASAAGAALPWWQQVLAGLALGLAVASISLVTTLRKPGADVVQRTSASYARLDLGGLNPVWISLGAGISEELLFRAALQPLAGIWITSLLFLAVHAGAYDFRRFDRAALLQAGGVFGMSVLLGLAFDHIGLLAAMLAHTVVDIVGLYLVLRISEGAKRLR